MPATKPQERPPTSRRTPHKENQARRRAERRRSSVPRGRPARQMQRAGGRRERTRHRYPRARAEARARVSAHVSAPPPYTTHSSALTTANCTHHVCVDEPHAVHSADAGVGTAHVRGEAATERNALLTPVAELDGVAGDLHPRPREAVQLEQDAGASVRHWRRCACIAAVWDESRRLRGRLLSTAATIVIAGRAQDQQRGQCRGEERRRPCDSARRRRAARH